MQRAIPLEPEQEQLFVTLVEATRSVPRERRESFSYIPLMGADLIDGNDISVEVLAQDVHVLQSAGLIQVQNYHTKGGGFSFFVPPDAMAYYEELKRGGEGPTAAVEHEVQAYLDGARFQAAYPSAYARWSEAADLLWGADSERELSTIGHKCREAIQEFVSALIEKHKPPEVNPDTAKTRDRLSAVLRLRKPDLGEARSELLDALFEFWRAGGNLIQRQEHAGQREGEPLVWEDGRRVVFQTAVIMFEIDRAL